MENPAVHSGRKPSRALSVAIFAAAVAAMALLRFYIFPDDFITLTYGLPLLVCLWHRDRWLLWSMTATFTAMAAAKALFVVPDPGHEGIARSVQWLMEIINVVVIAGSVHAIIRLTRRLYRKNVLLEAANEELSARQEEIAHQTDELQAQSEELAQQNEELQQQAEELNRQTEELRQQSEELEQQMEELQTQSEELRVTNDELNRRETMLSEVLALLQDAGDERHLMRRICESLLKLLGGAASAAAVVEHVGEDLVVHTHAGFESLAQQRWPLTQSFCSVVMQHDRTGFIDDLAARPDLIVPHPPGHRFRSILAAPLHRDGAPIGAVEVYAEQPRHWIAEDFRIAEWVAGQCSMFLKIVRSKQAQRDRAEELEKLMDLAPVAIWVSRDPQCRQIVGNRLANEFYEAQSSENVSATTVPEARRFFHDGRELAAEQLPMQVAARENREVVGEELEVRMASGRRIFMLGSASPLRDEHGNVRGCLGAFMNITQRKHTQECLERSLRQFELLAGTAGDLLTTRQPQMIVEALCRKVMEQLDCHAFFNFLVDEKTGRLRLNAYAGIPDDQAREMEWLEYGTAVCGCVARDGRRIISEHIPSTEDVRTQLVKGYGIKAYACHPLTGPGGEVIGTLSFGTRSRETFSEDDLSLMKAVTDHVATAMVRMRDEQAVSQGRAQLQTIVENLSEGVVVADLEGRLFHWNPAALAMHGFASLAECQRLLPELAGIFELAEMDGTLLPLEQWPLARILRGDKLSAWDVRVRRIGTDWQRIFSYSGSLVVAADGQPLLAVVTVNDVTERRQAEEQLKEWSRTLERRVAERTAEAGHRARQLQRLAGELTRAEQGERQRLATILHDGLQQLLVGAKFHVDIVRSQTSDPRVREGLCDVDNLLDESLATSRSLTAELSPPILREGTFLQVLHWLVRWAKEKHALAVEVSADEQVDPQDHGVRILLFHAMRELLLNVRKHANVSKARIEVKRDGRQMEIVVADEGAGFDADGTRPRRSDTNGSGSGFGLFSIAERLELLSGRLEVTSRPGQGTRVRLVAPLEASAPQAVSVVPLLPSTPDDKMPLPGRDSRKIRVLLADDHAVVRDGLARLLGMQPDITVTGQAEDGAEAVEMAMQLRPDVIVMDVSMPNLGGVEATSRILRDLPDTRVIGLSMHAREDVAAEMIAAGAAVYLTKTSAPAKLLEAIRQCVCDA